MKNIIKKVIIVMILVVMMFTMSGYTYTYETEEPPVALIMELVDAGFKVSEDDSDVWTFDGEEDGMMIYAVYDVYYNRGAMYATDIETGERVIMAFEWNCDGECFDSTAEYED